MSPLAQMTILVSYIQIYSAFDYSMERDDLCKGLVAAVSGLLEQGLPEAGDGEVYTDLLHNTPIIFLVPSLRAQAATLFKNLNLLCMQSQKNPLTFQNYSWIVFTWYHLRQKFGEKWREDAAEMIGRVVERVVTLNSAGTLAAPDSTISPIEMSWMMEILREHAQGG